MSHYVEEIQARKYLDHLIAVDTAEWQWFASQQCFEVGDAAARPRVYFDLEEQFQMYILTVYLEVDGDIASSTVLHVGREMPKSHEELLSHITSMEQAPFLLALLARLLRDRNSMATSRRPDHLPARVNNLLAIIKQKVLVDLPHNVQQRMTMYRVERNASRVVPKPKRTRPTPLNRG
jgi:hypothetical protein